MTQPPTHDELISKAKPIINELKILFDDSDDDLWLVNEIIIDIAAKMAFIQYTSMVQNGPTVVDVFFSHFKFYMQNMRDHIEPKRMN